MSDQPELLCTRCQDQAVRISELEAALRSLSDELEARSVELAGARSTQITLERQITKLRTDLSRAAEADPKSEQIRGILDYWKVKTGHTRARVPLTGERAKLVKGKLRTYKVAELMEAIDGLSLLPYVRNGKRVAYGHSTERYDQLDHCIGDEKRIENNRRTYLRAQEAAEGDLTLLWDAHAHYSAMCTNYMQLILEAACKRDLAAGDDVVASNVVRLKEIQSCIDDQAAA
jgi:hypothetical protein